MAPCSTCRGTGRIPLAPPLEQTLRLITSYWQRTSQIMGEHRNAFAINGTTCPQPNALTNRLNTLYRMKLVKRRHASSKRGGKEFAWRLAP